MQVRRLCSQITRAAQVTHSQTSFKGGTFSCLQEASRNADKVIDLDLSSSETFICKNIMCEKIEQLCICRFSQFLFHHCNNIGFSNLERVSLRSNRLDRFPTALEYLAKHSTRLREIDLRNNVIRRLDPNELSFLNDFPNLERILLQANPLKNSDVIKAHKNLKTSLILF